MEIDSLPLDVFGDNDSSPTHLAPVDEADPLSEQPALAERLECQWCDEQLLPDMATCPRCGSPIADPTLEVPGLTHPLPGSTEDIPDRRPGLGSYSEAPAVESIAAEIVVSVVKSLLSRRG
jgi:hypothetical protein